MTDMKRDDGGCWTCASKFDVHTKLRADDGVEFWINLCDPCDSQVRLESDNPQVPQPLIDRIMGHRGL